MLTEKIKIHIVNWLFYSAFDCNTRSNSVQRGVGEMDAQNEEYKRGVMALGRSWVSKPTTTTTNDWGSGPTIPGSVTNSNY